VFGPGLEKHQETIFDGLYIYIEVHGFQVAVAGYIVSDVVCVCVCVCVCVYGRSWHGINTGGAG
jgi:hypothetical protein